MGTFTPGLRPSDRKQLAAWYGALLDKQERRGLSVAKFAREIGMNLVTLYDWKRRLRPRVDPPRDPHSGLGQVSRLACAKLQTNCCSITTSGRFDAGFLCGGSRAVSSPP